MLFHILYRCFNHHSVLWWVAASSVESIVRVLFKSVGTIVKQLRSIPIDWSQEPWLRSSPYHVVIFLFYSLAAQPYNSWLQSLRAYFIAGILFLVFYISIRVRQVGDSLLLLILFVGQRRIGGSVSLLQILNGFAAGLHGLV